MTYQSFWRNEPKSYENDSIFNYFLSPTFDFKQELLLHGDEIEVLAPDRFRKEMRDTIRNMNTFYGL